MDTDQKSFSGKVLELHVCLTYLYVLFRPPLAVFDPDDWADKVRDAIIAAPTLQRVVDLERAEAEFERAEAGLERAEAGLDGDLERARGNLERARGNLERARANLSEEERERIECAVDGALIILYSLTRNIAGKPRGSSRLWQLRAAWLVSRWLSAIRQRLTGKATPPWEPRTPAEAGKKLADELSDLYLAFGILGRKQRWIEAVTHGAFGPTTCHLEYTVDGGLQKRWVVLKIAAAAKLCRAVLKQL